MTKPDHTFEVTAGSGAGRARIPVRVFEPHDVEQRRKASVLLLHGWPQDGHSWDRVVPWLQAAGYRCYVPDLRGTQPDAPRSRWHYRASLLIADVEAVLGQVGESVHVVGHDWGAALAWYAAADIPGRRPEAIRSLAAVSVAHPGAFLASFVTSKQALRSWYMGLFQLPVLPELVLGSPTRAARLLQSTGQSPADAARDAARLRDRAVRRGGLNWYRAMALGSPAGLLRKVDVPVLQLWSSGDTALGPEAARASARFAADFTYAEIAHASHWVPDEAPEALAEQLLAHFARVDA